VVAEAYRKPWKLEGWPTSARYIALFHT
jgi:hypothetical protein